MPASRVGNSHSHKGTAEEEEGHESLGPRKSSFATTVLLRPQQHSSKRSFSWRGQISCKGLGRPCCIHEGNPRDSSWFQESAQ